MTNITPVISSLLVNIHSSVPIHRHVHSPDRLDTFLQEAYRINAHISSLLLYLRQIRQPYLSTASAPPPPRHRAVTNNNHAAKDASAPPTHLTDPQRAEIDTQTSTLLHDLNNNISSLTAAENLRSSTEAALLERRFGKRGGARNNLLWRWAAGGAEDNDEEEEDEDEALGKSTEQLEAEGRAHGIKAFREGVLWYLGWRLQGAVGLQRQMVEVRAAREREKEKSVLWKMKTATAGSDRAMVMVAGRGGGGSGRGGGGGQIPRRTPGMTINADADHHDEEEEGDSPAPAHDGRYHPGLDDDDQAAADIDPETENNLPAHLLTLFASESSSLLSRYDSQLAKIAQAERSLLEISSLQSTLLSHLSTQGEMIEHLVTDAQGTGENVKRGNRELKRAGERWGKGLARGVFWGSVGLCGFLVGWDLVF